MKNELLGYVRKAIEAVPEVRGYLSQETLQALSAQKAAMKSVGDFGQIVNQYRNSITNALIGYFEGGRLDTNRNAFTKAMATAFTDAFETGWQDGGAALPVDDEAASSWIASRIDTETGFISGLFDNAKELRKDKEFDFFSWITARVDGYVSACTEVYNVGMMFANKNQMLEWVYGDAEHCATCNDLNGQRHKAIWYISRNYIPGKPGAAMDCGGYRCKCGLKDKNGEWFTV